MTAAVVPEVGQMGNEPEDAGLDRWCMTQAVPNLRILCTSCFPTTRPATLTVQALAWRTAEHIVRNWRSIAPSGRG
jgi:choline dehydrogenase-like flavoprotein